MVIKYIYTVSIYLLERRFVLHEDDTPGTIIAISPVSV